MGKLHQAIDGRLKDFLLAQKMFFVATAPTAADGRINVSPKGLTGSFAVLGPDRVAYLDYTGSGVETIAHLRDNGRIVLMFCAFEGPPNIVRLHGQGVVVLPGDPRYDELIAAFEPAPEPGLRSVIEVTVTRVSDSCGFGVPLMTYDGDRDLLPRHWRDKGPGEIAKYQATRNATSIDGQPAFS